MRQVGVRFVPEHEEPALSKWRQRLPKGLSTLTHAEKLDLALVATVDVPVETLPTIVSFGEPVRSVSSAFTRQLMDSFYEGGLVLQDGEAILTVCLEFVEEHTGVSHSTLHPSTLLYVKARVP